MIIPECLKEAKNGQNSVTNCQFWYFWPLIPISTLPEQLYLVEEVLSSDLVDHMYTLIKNLLQK